MKKLLHLFLLIASGSWAGAQTTTTQTFNLQAGWNSIWLEVEPPNTDVNVVFAGLPVDAVWTFQKRLTTVDYIQDVNEPVWNRDEWLVHVPTNRIEAINNNLFHVFGYRPYLVRLTSAATLNVTGEPVIQNVPWAPDAYNLRGYPVDPAILPTFNNFFRHSSAHFSSVSNRLERIYKLNPSGNWILVGPGEPVQRGVAYWTYSRGGSDYQAPLMIDLGGVGSLDFAETVDQSAIRLINRTPGNVTATIRDQVPPAPLSYVQVNSSSGLEWLNLPAPLSSVVLASQPLDVRLAIRRGAITGPSYGSLLEIKDGTGTRWLVPARAQRRAAVAGASPRNYVGLWAGNITVNSVNEVNNLVNPSSPTATGSDFTLRLLLHVDNNGVTRLLREAIQLWKDGTTTNNAEGQAVTATRGRYLLVTDERLIPGLGGSVLRDGQMAGRRMSAAGFDFPTSADANYLPLNGAFGGTDPVTGSFVIPSTFARNPFLHRYHPDHDNLNVAFNAYREEAYNVTRSFELRFSPTNLTTTAATDYGYKVLTGTYRETVTGLNKASVIAGGVFRLNRVSEIGQLNQ